ncbi:hypothetical protein STENM223S_03149 [Streptomyces tendae]
MTDTPDPDADRCAYSRTALARLALSAKQLELVDRALTGVPTTHDVWARPGEMVGTALGLVHQTQEVLAQAVVYERQKHTSAEEGRAEAAQHAEEARALAVQLRAETRESGEGTS